MPTQVTTAPFYTSKNKIVTLWNDGKRRIMRIDIGSGEPQTIDVTSLPMDALRGHAEAISLLVARVIEKTRATERAKHGRELLLAYTHASREE